MNKDVIKSIGAVLAGLVFIGLTHTAIDAILEKIGVLPSGHLNVGPGIIFFVIFYRALFSFAGCYLTARLSAKDPMKHSLILGGIGTLLSIAGAIVTTNMHVAPIWYGLMLVFMSLPIAWIAGRLYLERNRRMIV
ncbi:MAG TPA: hypothetical protein VF691_01020 [Cytophagaceae bacterium]|jgi:hypothetical protein